MLLHNLNASWDKKFQTRISSKWKNLAKKCNISSSDWIFLFSEKKENLWYWNHLRCWVDSPGFLCHLQLFLPLLHDCVARRQFVEWNMYLRSTYVWLFQQGESRESESSEKKMTKKGKKKQKRKNMRRVTSRRTYSTLSRDSLYSVSFTEMQKIDSNSNSY